jgi:hypothetical protein
MIWVRFRFGKIVGGSGSGLDKGGPNWTELNSGNTTWWAMGYERLWANGGMSKMTYRNYKQIVGPWLK